MRPGCDHDGPASGFDLSLRLRGPRLSTGIRLSDLERVWEIVTDHLPPLRTPVEKLPLPWQGRRLD